MSGRQTFRSLLALGFAANLFACATAADDDPTGADPKIDPDQMPGDIARATAELPEAEVLEATADGVPTFLRGDLGKVGDLQTDDRVAADAALRPALGKALAPFRLTAADVKLRKLNVDDQGNRHFRYDQVFKGLDVVGGDLVVHVDVKGTISGINGRARGDIPATLGANDIGATAALARVAADSRFAQLAAWAPRTVYIITAEGAMHKAYEIVVEGFRGQDPARDSVYVSVDTGKIVAVYPKIYFAENRKVYSANNGTSLPGTLKRSEGQAANSDVDVNAAYDGTGGTYEFYKGVFNRDSYDNAGAQLTSSVHYSSNYCNAFWNGAQMAYGDGSGASCLPLARSQDVTAHELTHAVTENESGLIYSGESGGINEALSDIFGNTTEAWVDGGKNGTFAISGDTWLVGEDILPPYLRKMNDPAADGASLDFWTSGAGNVDVHYSSGIANLAYYLLTVGGTHPRGKSTTVVTGIGMDKAIRIFYEAQINILTSTSNYAALRTAAEQAASNLGYDAATKAQVTNAFCAVGVNAATGCGGTPPPPPPGDVVLTNGVAATGLSDSTVGGTRFFTLAVPAGATGLKFVLAGGTGDADMYVRFGSKPTTSAYDCRPYLNGNNETCSVTTAQAGTYYVMLRAYAAYSGASLTGSYTTGGGGGGDPYLTNGVPVSNISGATGTNQYWRIAPGAGKTLTVKINGGTGDADLYTRFGSRPTTSTWSCRPYLNGNNETCTLSNTQSGDYYIMLRGYAAYSGVTLTGSF